MKPKFSVSLMCMDFLDIKNQVNILNERAYAYHVDIMDGHYCKNITLSPDFVKCIQPITKIPMDAHLMTVYPDDWIELLAQAGVTTISPHAETINTDAFRILDKIKSLGCKVGIVLNPATPLEAIQHYIGRLDLITIMTVDVGYAGQAFIPEMLDKIAKAKALKEKHGYHYEIQIDGSCNKKTFKQLHDAGSEIYVVGSSGLFGLDRDLSLAFDKLEANFAQETGQ